jgi:acyl-CoA synthetase (AMP-forming)/AMP-acid ligase II
MDSANLLLRGEESAYALGCSATGTWWTVADVRAAVSKLSAELLEAAGGKGRLVVLAMRNDIPSVMGYLAALEACLPVALVDGQVRGSHLDNYVRLYRPSIVLGRTEQITGYENLGSLVVAKGVRMTIELKRRNENDATISHPDLAVLLSTSGSTGSPRFVRLSRRAIVANAEQIAAALSITSDERAPTTLPLHYSYGLSILNSHLVAGASVLVSDAPLLGSDLWSQMRENDCTSFAGVPYSYEILRRLDVARLLGPRVKTMTQAGGRLAPERIREFHQMMLRRGGRFIVMYGQTEATARIAVLPGEMLPEKLGSAGLVLPRAVIEIRDEHGNILPHGADGEVVFHGPNVMMGYAESAEDLDAGDDLNGRLATGDLGYLDADGVLFITGRRKRIAKVLGYRVSLDEIEAILASHGRVAVLDRGERIIVYCEGWTQESASEQRTALARALGLHISAFEFKHIDQLPLLPSGKIDYQRLGSQ